MATRKTGTVGAGRDQRSYHQEVFECSSSHHPSLHFFFFLDLISIEILPTFGEFSSSRIDLFSSRSEEHDEKLGDVCTHIKECDVKEGER